MAEKTLKTRIIQKHDTEANWLLATNFTPMNGEIIIYDEDDNYDYKRIKIGNGINNVNDLDFVVNKEDIPTQIQANWDQGDETALDYIQNRTHYKYLDELIPLTETYSVTNESVNFSGTAGSQYEITFNNIVYNVTAGNGGGIGNPYLAKLANYPISAYGIEPENNGLPFYFIKNNLFFTGTNVFDVDVKVKTASGITMLQQTCSESGSVYKFKITLPSQLLLVENNTYQFTIDNIKYSCVCKSHDNYLYLGNGSLINSKIEGNDQSFVLYMDGQSGPYFKADVPSIHNVILEGNKIKQLSEEYISYKPGKIVTGQTFIINEEEIIANNQAEIFNSYSNIATGESSHAEGSDTKAIGNYSHAEGRGTTASGNSSHTEGYNTIASGYSSHAEGDNTTASGDYSHTEGKSSKADGYYSHAEGYYTVASGDNSHAEGDNTIASGEYQHVQGKYNIEDTEDKYAHIIGNGDYIYNPNTQSFVDVRSNAHTIDWEGNAEFQGDVIAYGCDSPNGEPISLKETYELATQDRVTSWNDLEDKPFEFLGEKIYEEFLVRSDDTSTEVYYYDSTYVQSSAGAAIKWKEMVLFINGKYYNVIKDETEWLYYYNGERVLEYDWEYWVHFYPQALGLDDTVPSYEFILYEPGEFKQIDEHFIPDTIARVSDIPEVAQSDWLVNDESNPAYVKNRPFYTTEPKEIVIFEEQTIEGFEQWEESVYAIEGIELSKEFILGQAYTVTWDGTTYENLVSFNNDIYTTIGATYGNYSTYPFGIDMMYTPVGATICLHTNSPNISHTLSISTIQPTHIKIDEKYLPDSVFEKVGKSTTGTLYNIDGEEIFAEWGAEIFNNYENNIATGYCSHAEGSETIASGWCSHAEGEGTTASEQGSHAEGSSTKAIDWSSHAEGIQTTASGEGSHAEGRQTTASGKNSHAEGGALSNTGTTISDKIITSSDYSGVTEDIAVKGPISYGIQSHAEGTQTLAFEYSSHAEGYQTLAFGYSSHTEGFQTRAYGDYSHAEGDNTKASGDYGSHAEGYHTIASGQYSHAEGSTTTAYGSSSHAEGYYTTASGSTSHAEGFYTRATGYNSHAEGNRTLASGQYQHVQGKYNIDDVDAKGNALHTYAHIVGNGESDYARSNAHTLDWDGNAWFAGDVTATDAEGNSVSILSLLTEINNLKAELAILKATYAELTETDANALVEEVFN